MSEETKKYYWIKLRTDFFNREEIDFLLSQENGCEYVVLYQMLCLSSANTNGRLESQMNEVIIPYDINKIVRDCKYFSYDTVVVALELYKKLGLIYEEDGKTLKIANIERMIGSESATKEAVKKREQRLKKKLGTQVGTKCPIENRDKILDNRDIDNILINNNYYNNNIYEFIEQNYVRTISPLEKEQIDLWIKEFDQELIIYAFKISIMNNKKNFNYVKAILKNWKAAGYKTIQDVKDNEKKKEEPKKEVEPIPEELKEVLDYNWFDEEL